MVGRTAAVNDWLSGRAPRAAIGPEWNLAVIGWSRKSNVAIGGKGSGG